MQVARHRLSGRPGKRGNASRPSGSVLRARIDRSKGCARASAQLRTRELGTARKRAGIVAEVVRRRFGPEKRRAHHSTELVPRRDRGPSPRAEAAWRHVARSRGERLFLQGERPRKGTIAFGERACEEASFASGHGGKVVESTRGRAAPPVSETRPGGGALGYRTREGTSDRESSLRSRAGGGNGLGDLRRILIARQAPGFESREVTGVSEARSS